MTIRPTTLIAGGILALALSLSGCDGKDARMGSHMQKGRDYFAEGNLDKARVELRNVLQMEPRHVEAYLLAARIEEQQRNLQKAFANYQKVVELDPNNLEARARIGRFMLFGGELAKAEQSAKDILNKKPDDPAALTLLAGVLAQKKDIIGATELAQRVIAQAPTYVEAYGVLAGLLSGQDKRGEAAQVLEQGVLANPKQAELRLSLVALAISENAPEKAMQQYRELIALEPKRGDHRVGLARLQLAANDLQGAEKTLRDAIQAAPGDDLRYLALVDLLASTGRVDVAEKELRGAIEATPEAYRLSFRLAELYQATGKAEQAAQVFDSLIKRDKLGPDGLRARTQLANLRLIQERREEATRLVAEVLKESPRDNDALSLRGRMHLAAGDPVSAVADFRSVLKDQPGSVDVMVGLARAHLANKESQLAVETIGKMVSLNPKNSSANLLLAEVKAATGDRKGAMTEVLAVLKTDPRSYQALLAKVGLEVADKDLGAAEKTLIALVDAYPQDPQASYRLGDIQQVRRKYDAAIASYEKALLQRPGAIEPLTGLASVHLARSHPEIAIQRVGREVDERPKNYAARLLLARLFDHGGKLADAESAFRKAIEVEPGVAVTHVELANFFRRHKDPKKEVEALNAGLAALPSDIAIRLELAAYHHRTGEVDQAMAQYEAVLKQAPGNDVAANNLANLLLDARSDKGSAERALQLSERFKTSANLAYLDTFGWAGVRAGRLDEGLAALRKVVEKAPDVPVFQYHLGAALQRKGEVDAAKQLLSKAVAAADDFSGKKDARQLLGKI